MIDIQNLSIRFPLTTPFWQKKQWLYALNDISLSLKPGETLGIAGESGSGKSTLLKSILKLHPFHKGNIYFEGQSIQSFNKKQTKNMRHEIQMVFQNPYSSLNPKMRIIDILSEGLNIHKNYSRKQLQTKSIELFEAVNLDPDRLNDYPHSFSGGQRQRIAIAKALATEPKVILADEPTSALDVSIQYQILQLFQKIQKQYNLSLMMVSHSLEALAQISHHLAIFYMGHIVEYGPTEQLLSHPKHPYTQALINSALSIHTRSITDYRLIQGEPPSLSHPPKGCPFHPRCPIATEACQASLPAMQTLPTQSVRCLYSNPS
jgi:oligopeptide/dipeptide ABC transporter ATP-binding protein